MGLHEVIGREVALRIIVGREAVLFAKSSRVAKNMYGWLQDMINLVSIIMLVSSAVK